MATTMKKKRPRIGDRLYRVEWCSALAFYDNDLTGDVDRDKCTMSSKCFVDHDKARAFAEEIWPKTHETFGIVEVDLMEFVPYDEADVVIYPHVGFWEQVADSEIFSGEWEA